MKIVIYGTRLASKIADKKVVRVIQAYNLVCGGINFYQACMHTISYFPSSNIVIYHAVHQLMHAQSWFETLKQTSYSYCYYN